MRLNIIYIRFSDEMGVGRGGGRLMNLVYGSLFIVVAILVFLQCSDE